MTILKFRAWIKEEKRMLPVALINFNQSYVLAEENNGLCCERDFDEIELMQSIGMVDENGKEIFEGDIVKLCFKEDGLFEICLDTVGGFYTKSVLTGKIQFLEVSDFDELETAKEVFNEYVEVVGNIYKNPELVEEE